MVLHKLVLLFALLNIINAQYSNKHMICKEVNNIFSNDNHGSYSRRQLQGPTGKRGQPGVKGEPGSPGATGQPGAVHYERIAELVRAEVEKKTLEMASEIQFLKQNQRNLTELIEQNMTEMEKRSQTPINCESHEGVTVGSKCFVTEVHATRDTTLSEADEICRNKKAKLADILSRQEYEAIMEIMRKKISHGESIVVWTGMTRDKDGNAVLSNGQISPYKKTRTDPDQWTSAEASRTHVYLQVTRDVDRQDQGLGSIWPGYELQGSLCAIE